MNRKETTEIILALVAGGLLGGPDAKLLPSTIALYAEHLANVPVAAVAQAVHEHINDATPTSDSDHRPRGRWWMTIADILQAVERQTAADPAEWERVCVVAQGYSEIPPLGTPERSALIDVGGLAVIRARPVTDEARMKAKYLSRLAHHRRAALVTT